MSNKSKPVIWINPDQKRYFLVPDDYSFPVGHFAVYSLNGDQVHTVFLALTSFEVTQEEAEAHFAQEVAQVFEHVRTLIEALFSSGKQTRGRRGRTKGYKEIEDFLKGLKTLLEGAIDQNPAQLKASQAQLRHLRERLKAQGLDLKIDLEELPNKLWAWYASTSDEESMRKLGSQLVAFTGQPTDSSIPLGQQIDDAIEELEKIFGNFMADKERQASLREEQRQRIRQSANMDIAQALRARGITPITSIQALLRDSDKAIHEQTTRDVS